VYNSTLRDNAEMLIKSPKFETYDTIHTINDGSPSYLNQKAKSLNTTAPHTAPKNPRQ